MVLGLRATQRALSPPSLKIASSHERRLHLALPDLLLHVRRSWTCCPSRAPPPPAPRAPSCALIAEVAVAAAAANEPFGSTKPRRSHPALLWSSHSTSRSHFLRMGPRSQTRWRSGFRRRQTACRICKDGRVTAAALDAGPPDLALVLSPPLVVEVLERRGQQ